MAIGKLLILFGLMLVVAGLIVNYAPWLFNWFGKLPGDINIRDEKRAIFIPITSMLLLSIIISIILNLFFRK